MRWKNVDSAAKLTYGRILEICRMLQLSSTYVLGSLVRHRGINSALSQIDHAVQSYLDACDNFANLASRGAIVDSISAIVAQHLYANGIPSTTSVERSFDNIRAKVVIHDSRLVDFQVDLILITFINGITYEVHTSSFSNARHELVETGVFDGRSFAAFVKWVIHQLNQRKKREKPAPEHLADSMEIALKVFSGQRHRKRHASILSPAA